jgi:hypothetical protein
MNKQFLLIFSAVVLLTAFCGLGSGFLAVAYGADMPSPLLEFQKQLTSLFTAGAGAIIALLAVGKASI